MDLSRLLRTDETVEPVTTSLVTPDTVSQPVVSALTGPFIGAVQEKKGRGLITKKS